VFLWLIISIGMNEKRIPYRNTQKLRDEQWLYNKYVNEQKSSIDIAKELGVSKTAVLRWLKNHKIKAKKRYKAVGSGQL